MGNMGEFCAETALSDGASQGRLRSKKSIPSVAFVLRSACNASTSRSDNRKQRYEHKTKRITPDHVDIEVRSLAF
jgi:hypothetical protein